MSLKTFTLGMPGFAAVLALALGWPQPLIAGEPEAFKFSFGEPERPGFRMVEPGMIYSEAAGFGFEPGPELVAKGGRVTSDEPFCFSVKLPEGNYAVTVTLGASDSDSETTVKAELRRLMVGNLAIRPGETRRRTFVVNLRNPTIPGAGEVRLKAREREQEMVNWDDRLTLEFSGARPALRALELVATNVPTVFLLGDSTVCDQPHEPWNSWGQMLPRFFGPAVAVANHAQSGESIRSSLSARRFDKVFSQITSNDWLFLQFGHNDMKDRATNALATYQANLKQIVARTRAKGATPVLLTSMERKAGCETDTLQGYPQAVRDLAREKGVALIDLHAMSKVLYRALGANLDQAFQDGTHHNNYGSYELARCVVTGIQTQLPDLAKWLAADVGVFDPAQPDPPGSFRVPASRTANAPKPDGN